MLLKQTNREKREINGKGGYLSQFNSRHCEEQPVPIFSGKQPHDKGANN